MKLRKLPVLAGGLATLLAFALALEGAAASRSQRRLQAAARLRTRAEAVAAAGKLARDLAGLEALGHRLRLDLERGRLRVQDLPGREIADLAQAPEACLDLGVLSQPDSGAALLSGPCAFRDSASRPAVRSEAGAAGRGWGEPHADGPGGARVVDYLEPFRIPGSRAGVVRLQLSLDGLRRMVARAEAGAAAYGFLLSAKGVYLSDPRSLLVAEGQNIQASDDPGRQRIAALALRGAAGFAEGVDPLTGHRQWFMLEPVAGSPWSLGTVVLRDEVIVLSQSVRARMLWLVSLGVALVLALLVLAAGLRTRSLGQLWGFTGAGALVITLGIGSLWYFGYTLAPENSGAGIQVQDPGSLQNFLDQHARLDAGSREVQAELIPTGIFVETLELLGGGQVRVTGKVWQRFPLGAPLAARAGLDFPEAVSGEVDPPVVRTVGAEQIQFSGFRVVLNQKLVSRPNYPFDRAQVRLWLRQKAMWRDELLVPDLDAYQRLLPETRPGLEQELTVLGWKVERSFFSYLQHGYNANFGMEDYVGLQSEPELLFNISLRREFLNPLIATFLPILAVLGLLFVAMLAVTRDPDRTRANSYQCFNFLRNAATLLLPLVLAQINLRSHANADRMLFLEHYYLVVYGLILLVSANALVFAESNHPALTYRDNALPKLAFWPVLCASFFLVSTQFI
jgi:hypothetical protein